MHQASPVPHARLPQRIAVVPIAVAVAALALVLPAVPAHAVDASPIGSFDSAALAADGSVALAGWTADPDSAKTSLRVDLTDNGLARTSLIANVSRPDVAAAHPNFGAAHGFVLRLAVGDGTHQFCVVAENFGPGPDPSLGCRTLAVHNNPTGTMSAAVVSGNTATFTGTATDVNSSAPVVVSGYVDGKHTLDTTASNSGHGYSIAVPVGEGSHSVCLYAINLGLGNNTRLGCQTLLIRNNPLGALETAGQVPAGVQVSGYAIDLNTTASISVWAFVDGKYAARSVASISRPDLATKYPGAGIDHGYSMLLTPSAGSHQVCLWAINTGPGSNVQLGCRTITMQNNPIGRLESAIQLPAGVQVTGWALDLNSLDPVTVNLTLDGHPAGSVPAAVTRPDLAAYYPNAGLDHGLSSTLDVPAGSHRICAGASNIGPGANSTLNCVSVTVRNNPTGMLDGATQVPGGLQLRGWALDLNAAAPVSVFLYVDGHYVNRTSAALARTDLLAHYPTVGDAHGYSLIVPVGPGRHTVCAWAINIGAGVNTLLACRTANLRDLPLGNLDSVQQTPGGVLVTGWAMDSYLTSPITVRIYVDGRLSAIGTANQARSDLAALYPNMGPAHGYSITAPIPVGKHTLCGYAINPRHATNLGIRCLSVTRLANPVGSSAMIARSGITDTITVSGWALDPDTTAPIQLHVTSDGVDVQTVTANLGTTAAAQSWPLYGVAHGYSAGVTLDSGEHTVCVIAYNVGTGANTRLGCTLILTSGEGAPAAPVAPTAWPGSKTVALGWTAPRSDNAPITKYLITIVQRGTVITVAGSATGATVGSLTNGVHYTFSIRAVNSIGVGSAVLTGAIPTNIPPQVTPAPVSTSHYLRNLTGNLASDAALMRTMGAVDASYNPSGHSYLVLLQIGGQDELDHGAVLSATSRFVSYAAVVNAMKAYLDGYATRQRPYAPLTLAIGTNNDMDVSASAGISWARNVVGPVVSYAAAHHPGVIIAGANDMEPGFSATVSQTRNWLAGYLSATGAPFVFNGSADGCSTTVASGWCNNGWRMSDLQWLSGGAAPTRTISLPQIYNYAMPLQWKYISLTGTSAGRPKIYFGGPLTEFTACSQAGSCGSISNVDAWSRLWTAISSSPATRQFQMPHGTDLRIN
ncbi:MAG TPA: fibronectin type III domain-containing protein [Jatrophihabitans sp.]|nr:fibronectin type III domain-containing protein [Jatrophihabitans sp.]